MQPASTAAPQAVSLVFFTDAWRPDSFYARILANRRRGLHTLCLLDIRVREPSLESLARGRKVRCWGTSPCSSRMRAVLLGSPPPLRVRCVAVARSLHSTDAGLAYSYCACCAAARWGGLMLHPVAARVSIPGLGCCWLPRPVRHAAEVVAVGV